MRIGRKSKDLLDLILLLGLELGEGILQYPSLYKSTSFATEQSFRRSIQLLKQNGWVELDNSDSKGQWVGTITREGRSIANSSIDPKPYWESDWDGEWRIFTFDLPSNSTAERQALRKWLLAHKFGRLQGSVWITPRDLGDWSKQLSNLDIDPAEVIYISGKFGGMNQNHDYIERAWNFDQINKRYMDYQQFLSNRSPQKVSKEDFSEWFREERDLWEAAFSNDPLLPQSLWSEDFRQKYQGPKSYELRQETYKQWKSALL